MNYIQQVARAAELGMSSAARGSDGKAITKVSNAGDALTLLRQRNKIRKSFNEMVELKQQTVETEKEKFYIMNNDVKVKVNITDKADVVDTLGFVLSTENLQAHEKKHPKKKMTSDDEDDEKPKPQQHRLNPRYEWGLRHLCADGSMPVASFSDKSVGMVREQFGFNDEQKELKRLRDEEKEKARLEEEARILRMQEEAARQKQLADEARRLEEEMEREKEEQARIRKEEKAKKRKEAREKLAKDEADAKEAKKQAFAAEMARREAIKIRLAGVSAEEVPSQQDRSSFADD